MADKTKSLKLILIRHPKTIWQNVKNPEKNNPMHRLLGQTDIELSRGGVAVARKLGRHFSKQKIDGIITSPLKRAFTTAEIIVSANGKVPVSTENNLMEINFGLCEGLTFGEVARKFPKVYKPYLTQSNNVSFPKGESFKSFRSRIKIWLKRFINSHTGKTILVVTHGGVIRVILCSLLHWSSKSFWQVKLDYGSVSIIEVYEKNCAIECLNYKI